MAAKVLVHTNPAQRGQRTVRVNPPALFILNDGGKKVMATKPKARGGSHKPAANRKAPAHNKKRASARHYAAAPKHNPKGRGPARNPRAFDMVKQTGVAFAGMALTDLAQNALPLTLPGGAWGKVAVRAVLAYGIAWLGERFFAAPTAQLLGVGGLIGCAQDAFRMGLSQLGGATAPKTPVIIAPPQLAPGVAAALPGGTDPEMADIVGWGPYMGDIVEAPDFVFQ